MRELSNGSPSIPMLGPQASSIDILTSQTSLKASDEGPSLVVFSGGTAFNSVAGMPRTPCTMSLYSHITIILFIITKFVNMERLFQIFDQWCRASEAADDQGDACATRV